jgi:hypothetical protein
VSHKSKVDRRRSSRLYDLERQKERKFPLKKNQTFKEKSLLTPGQHHHAILEDEKSPSCCFVFPQD